MCVKQLVLIRANHFLQKGIRKLTEFGSASQCILYISILGEESESLSAKILGGVFVLII